MGLPFYWRGWTINTEVTCIIYHTRLGENQRKRGGGGGPGVHAPSSLCVLPELSCLDTADGWMDGWMDEWLNIWMDKDISLF